MVVGGGGGGDLQGQVRVSEPVTIPFYCMCQTLGK